MQRSFKQHFQKFYRRFLDKATRVFYPVSLDEAKKMILSDIEHFGSDYRWKVETEEQIALFKQWIKPDAVVLDFGVGIGRVSSEILRVFPKTKVYGIDGSQKMLTYCKEYIPKEYHPRIQLVHFDEFSKIKDNSVDFVFSLYVLQHVAASGFNKAVCELYRVIKPGGFLYLLNGYHRCTFDDTHAVGYDDGIDQLKEIGKYFEEKAEVPYSSDYMKNILKTHFSKLFCPKK